MQRTATTDLFISYAEADRAWVHGFLIPELDLPPDRILTREEFRPGAFEADEFERAIMESRQTVLVLSAAYQADVWTQLGSTLALHLAVEEQENRLIPLLRDDLTLPLQIRSRIALDCRDPASWPHATAQLRQLLDQPAPQPVLIRCPYPGMVPFKQDDAPFFYGRADEIEALLLRLRSVHRLFVIGPSGSGKSSLVFAGLLPRLAQGTHFDPDYWRVCHLLLDEEPTPDLIALLDQEQGGQHTGRERARADGSGQRLLIVIDQFERLWTLASREEQARFIDRLQTDPRMIDATVIATMRADFYDALISSPLWPLSDSQRFEIVPLRGAALREAIEQPARDVGVYLEPELVQRLLHDATDQPGSLPLIQETMQALWGKRDRRLLTLRAYDSMTRDGQSGLSVAVAAKADAAIDALDAPRRDVARRIMLSLIHSDVDCPDTRRKRSRTALENLIDDPVHFALTLDHLIQQRLLTISGDDQIPVQMIEISHDILLRGWPRMQGWLEEGRAERLLHQRLEAAADEWHAERREMSFLIGGAQLEEAQRYAVAPSDGISQRLQEFLVASTIREGKRQRSRFLGQAAGGALGAALGYSLAFSLAQWMIQDFVLNRELLLLFLFMLPVGEVVGFCLGVGLWMFHYEPRQRIATVGLIGAVTSSVAYLIAVQLRDIQNDTGFRQLGAGALLGMGVGLGAGLPYAHKHRLMGTIIGGVIGAVLARTFGLLSDQWDWYIVLVSGLLLGGLTGLGFQATAVENNEYVTV